MMRDEKENQGGGEFVAGEVCGRSRWDGFGGCNPIPTLRRQWYEVDHGTLEHASICAHRCAADVSIRADVGFVDDAQNPILLQRVRVLDEDQLPICEVFRRGSPFLALP